MTRERSFPGYFQVVERPVVEPQQGGVFVAGKAKNPLSERSRFGIMRLASQ
jgi:hypothetical protein